MGIEKDINQTRFRSEYQKGVVNLTFTYNWLHEKMRNILDTEDITNQQFNILRILRGAGKPLSTLQIRQRMLDKMSDTSRIVDRLIIKGFVSKTTRPSDKRLVDISITDKGKKLLERLDKFDIQIDAILGNLSDSEIKTLNKILDKIRS